MASGKFFNVGDAEVRDNWEREVNHQAIQELTFANPKYGFIGTSPNSAIQSKDRLFEQGGSRATINLIRNLTGPPTGSNATLRGREESANTSTFRFEINTVRHATEVAGAIVPQRVPWYTIEELAMRLGTWAAQSTEAAYAMHLAGFNIDGTTSPGQWYLRGDSLPATFWNVPRTPDSYHILRPGNPELATDEAVGADPSAILDRDLIEKAKARAETLPIPIRPFRWNGRKIYGLAIHTYQAERLRQQDTEWYSLMSSALQGGQIAGNPIFTGALGMIDDVLIFKCPYLPPGIHSVNNTIESNVRRAVFFGAQALVEGRGRYPGDKNRDWKQIDESWDYSDKLGAAVATMRGVAAPAFTWYEDATLRDHGKIVIPTYATNAY